VDDISIWLVRKTHSWSAGLSNDFENASIRHGKQVYRHNCAAGRSVSNDEIAGL